VSLPSDMNDTRYACGILKNRDRTEGTVQVQKILLMQSTMKKLFKYAKRVGVDIAKSIPPPVDYVWRREITPKEMAVTLNCIHRQKKHGEGASDSEEPHVERAGILQNLKQAVHLLQEQKRTFRTGNSLISFLEEAVVRILGMTQNFCREKVGAEKCKIDAPSEETCRASVRHNRLSSESKKDLVEDFKSHGGGGAPVVVTHLDHLPATRFRLAKKSRSSGTSSDSSHGSRHEKPTVKQIKPSVPSSKAEAPHRDRTIGLSPLSLSTSSGSDAEAPSSASGSDASPSSSSDSSASPPSSSDFSTSPSNSSHSKTEHPDDTSSISATTPRLTSLEPRSKSKTIRSRTPKKGTLRKPTAFLSSHPAHIKSGVPGSAKKTPISTSQVPWNSTLPKSTVSL